MDPAPRQPTNRADELQDPIIFVAYCQAVCTGWKRWQDVGTSVPPETQVAKQGTNHQDYQDMKFTPPRLHEDQKSYPDGVTIKSDKYPETDYILKLLPQQHKFVVYHMSRQPADPARQKKADPLSASVVLFEQYKAAVEQVGLPLPWLLKSLKNINVASGQGSQVLLVIGTENQKLVTPSKQTLAPQEETLNCLCTEVNEISTSVKQTFPAQNKPFTERMKQKRIGEALKDAPGLLSLFNKVDPEIANFLALLGIENGSSVVWLIKDYGDKLKIKTITSIQIDGYGQNVTYHFVEEPD